MSTDPRGRSTSRCSRSRARARRRRRPERREQSTTTLIDLASAWQLLPELPLPGIVLGDRGPKGMTAACRRLGPLPRRPFTRVVPDLGSASRSTPFKELERSTNRDRTPEVADRTESGSRNGVFSLCCSAVSSQLHPNNWLPACPSASQPVLGHVWRRPPTRTDRESSGPLGRIGIVPTSLFPESSGCMAENHPRCVQQRATRRFGCISCNTPRQIGADSEYQRGSV